MSRFVKKDETFPIYLQLDRDDSGRFPSAIIVKPNNIILATLEMDPINLVGGKYSVNFSISDIGDYSIKFIVYKDTFRTQVDKKYRFGEEGIRVTNLEENVESLVNQVVGDPVADFN